MKKETLGLAAGLALLAIAALFFSDSHFLSLSEARIEQWVRDSGALGPLMVVFAQFAASVISPIPNSIFTIVAGRIYGGFWGGLYSYFGGLLGAAATFWIGRKLGRKYVSKFVSDHDLHEVERFLSENGVWAILGGRLLPFLSFDAVSYAAGMLSMDFWLFMLASAFGTAPPIFAYAYFGEYSKQVDVVTLAVISIAAIAVFWVLSKRLNGKHQGKNEQGAARQQVRNAKRTGPKRVGGRKGLIH